MDPAFLSLKQIIEQSFSRYIRVLPEAMVLPPNHKTTSIQATLSSFHPARTRYQNKKPICRSLDAVHSIKNKRFCASCSFKNSCTPQIGLELNVEGVPLKLMLSYTSMRNFLIFNAKRTTNETPIRITVRNRKTWGELIFSAS